MRENPSFKLTGFLLFFVLAAAAGVAQDFHKTYAIGAGGQINIGNISGDVKVLGYKGESIIVDGYKEGRDKDLVTIEDTSSANRLELRVRYPEHRHSNASVNFEVKVPESLDYNFENVSSVSGNISMRGVKGRMRAKSVSGNVDVTSISGIVSAESISGNVYVEINMIGGAGEMKFSSISGDVSVRAPKNLDADVDMSTISGSLKTDFSIEIHEPRYGPGRSARGRLGNGTNNLRITSVSGRVSLTRT
jgi:hypothetical protein